jgi:hypothetical protein
MPEDMIDIPERYIEITPQRSVETQTYIILAHDLTPYIELQNKTHINKLFLPHKDQAESCV